MQDRGRWTIRLVLRLLVMLLWADCLVQAGMTQTPSASPTPNSQPKLFFFTAVWCKPCHKLKPLVQKALRETKATIEMVEIDYDVNRLAVNDFEVKTLPTVVVIDAQGRLAFRMEGATSEGLKALRDYLVKSRAPAGRNSSAARPERR